MNVKIIKFHNNFPTELNENFSTSDRERRESSNFNNGMLEINLQNTNHQNGEQEI